MSYAGKNPGILRTKGEKGVISSTALVSATHQATVDSLASTMGKKGPKVFVGGNGYCIVAYFPARLLIDKLCDYARWNPTEAMTEDTLRQIVRDVNYASYNAPDKRIHVAGLPDTASRNVKNAAIAGCIHEEGHDLFTRQEELDFEEVKAIVMPRWNSVKNWAPYKGLLLQAANVFEDIYIERLLCAKFPGVRSKMAALQDFILTMEDKSREEAGADLTPISALMGLVRDLGLGYKTQLQREAIAGYRAAHPDVCDLIISGKGKPMMKEAIVDVSSKEAIEETMTKTMLSTKLALDLVILMEDVGGEPPEQPQGNEGGESECGCPKCKAPISKLRSKPVQYDDSKIAITCTECGWQEIIDKPEPQEGGEGEGDGGIGIETGDTQEGDQQGGGNGQTIKWDGSEEVENENKEGESSDGSGEGEEGEEQGSEAGSDKGEGSEAGSEDTSEKGEGSDKGDGPEIKDMWDGTRPDAGSNQNSTPSQESGSPEKSPETWGGVGGSEAGDDASKLKHLVDSIQNDGAADLMDYAQALGGETIKIQEQELTKDVKEGEAAYNPASEAGDKIRFVKADSEWHVRSGKEITKSVRRECAYMLARLRQIVMGQDEVIVDDGCAKGRKISARNLVNTYAQVRSFERPDRAFKRIDEEELPSTAAAVCVDESGSMGGILREAGQIAAAIAMPLDALGAKVMVHGIRDGGYYNSTPTAPNQTPTRGRYHRSESVNHDIIKAFDEPYRVAEKRFGELQASGGTPLADGIQFAMDNMEYRDEDNKIIFVVTDGWPNHGHVPVINRQIRLCQERGWHVIGVGVGYDARYVLNLFPDAVQADTVSEIPKLLVAKLSELMMGGKVGRRNVRTA